VLVDTRLVGEEILVDGEGSLDWSAGHDESLDGGNVIGLLDGTSLDLVHVKRGTVDALGNAWGSNTGSRGVGEAGVVDDTSVLHELPGVLKVATTTAVVSGVAGDQPLRREDDVDLAVGGNAESVGESLSGTEGPAGTALLLVSDGVDAVGPLGSGVERVGDGGSVGDNLLGSCEGGDLCSEELLGILKGETVELVVSTSSPGGSLVVVDGGNHFVIKSQTSGDSACAHLVVELDAGNLSSSLVVEGELSSVVTWGSVDGDGLGDVQVNRTSVDGALDSSSEGSAHVKSVAEELNSVEEDKDGDVTIGDSLLQGTLDIDVEVASNNWWVGVEGNA